MNKKDVDTLATACGEIARGFKKLRTVLLKLPVVPQITVPNEEVTVAPAQCKVFEFQHYDFVDLLCDRKLSWGADFEESLYRVQLQKKLRADRCGNNWTLQNGAWRPVSKRYVKRIFHELNGFLEEMNLLLADNSNGEFTNSADEPKKVRPCKWDRRKYIQKAELSEKVLRRFLIETHREIGSMRQRT